MYATGKKFLDHLGPAMKLMGEMNLLYSLKTVDKGNITIAPKKDIITCRLVQTVKIGITGGGLIGFANSSTAWC